MAVSLSLLAFVVAFGLAAGLAARMPAGTRWIPHVVLAAIAFLLFFELARYDHGLADVLFWIGFIVAPVIAIFGGAAWGSRRLYGWPDLGPNPPRAALVSAAVLVAVLMGVKQKPQDIAATEAALEAWATRNDKGALPRTHLGFVAPPEAELGLDAESRALVVAFPVGNGQWRMLDLQARKWRTSKQPPLTGLIENDEPK